MFAKARRTQVAQATFRDDGQILLSFLESVRELKTWRHGCNEFISPYSTRLCTWSWKMGTSTCLYRVMSHFLRYLKSGPGM